MSGEFRSTVCPCRGSAAAGLYVTAINQSRALTAQVGRRYLWAAIDERRAAVTGLSHRQTEILNIARASGRVMVEDLARRFEVSAQTIRKDLNDLCDHRSLTRIHGGAIIAGGGHRGPGLARVACSQEAGRHSDHESGVAHSKLILTLKMKKGAEAHPSASRAFA